MSGTYRSGDPVSVRIVWRADHAQALALQRIVEFRDGAGRVVSAATDDILPSYSTLAWVAGQVVEDRVRIVVPSSIGTGSYGLTLRVGSASVPLVRLGTIVVNGPERLFVRPTFAKAVDARIGSFATLLGFDLDRPHVAPGDRLGLTLVWAARGSADRNYTIFVHLVDARGQIQGQEDRQPLGGTRPTVGWTAS